MISSEFINSLDSLLFQCRLTKYHETSCISHFPEDRGGDEPQQYVELSQQSLDPGDDELLLEDGRVEAERYYGRWSLRYHVLKLDWHCRRNGGM